MNDNEPDNFIPFAEQLATMSGDVIRQYYGKTLDVEVKEDDSPVTRADREVERGLRAMIRNQFPEHSIIGEEYEPYEGDSEYTWIIDPIDGTKSFMIGRPIFGTLIALLKNDEPVLGVLDQPIIGERWTGAKGYNTELNDKPIKSRKCNKLDQAVLCTTSPNLFSENDFKSFEKIRKKSQYTVYGGDCYSYGLIAKGTVDIVIETDLKPFDFCALRPIIEGAGGIITDWQGNEITLKSDGKMLACGDKELHGKILDILNV